MINDSYKLCHWTSRVSLFVVLLVALLGCTACTFNQRPLFRSGIPPYKSNRVFISSKRTTKGPFIVTADGRLQLIENGKTHTKCQFSKDIQHADLSADGSIVGVVYAGKLAAYNTADCSLLTSYTFKKRVTSAAVSPLNDGMLMGGEEGSVYFWRFHVPNHDLLKVTALHQYPGHGNVVSAISFHPGGLVFFSGDWNGDLLVWERYDADAHAGEYDQGLQNFRFLIEKPERMQVRNGTPDPIEHLFVTRDGNNTLLLLESGFLEFYTTRGGERKWRSKLLPGLPRSAALFEESAESLVLALLDRERQLLVFRIDTTQDKAPEALTKVDQRFLAGADTILFDNQGQLYVGKTDNTVSPIQMLGSEEEV